MNRLENLIARLAGLALAMGLAGCSEPAVQGWSGYAEGEFVLVSAPIGGRLDQLRVKAGDRVIRGDALFALDAQSELAAQADAAATAADVVPRTPVGGD